MNLIELDRALRQLRLSGMAAVLDTRLRQAQTEKMAPIDLVCARRRRTPPAARPSARAPAQARALPRPERSLDTFDFDFNKKMNRALVYELATARFIAQRVMLFLGRPAPAKATWPKRSAARRSCRATASSIVRRTRCSKNSPRRRSPAPARLSRGALDGAAADHRRPRHAEAGAHGRRGSPRADHAPLRTRPRS